MPAPGDDARLAQPARRLSRAAAADVGRATRVLDKLPTTFWPLGLIRAAFGRADHPHRRKPDRHLPAIYCQPFEAVNTYTTIWRISPITIASINAS